jgi:hypothetical protein
MISWATKKKLSEVEESYLNHTPKNTFICELHNVHWLTDNTPSAASITKQRMVGRMWIYKKKINHDTQYQRWHWNTGHTRIKRASAHCKFKWRLLWGTDHRKQLMLIQCLMVAQDSSVSIATHYGLDCPGIESRWGWEFLHPSSQTGPEAHPVCYTNGTASFTGVKWPESGVGHPPPSSTKVKEREELYPYSPFGPPWLVPGWTLPLP